jgi:drug/metabolite transporter (DMT)-like permease
MILAMASWGFNVVVMKLAFAVFPPLLFSAIRHIGASLFFLVVLAVARRPLRLTGRDWAWMLALGLFGVALNQPFVMYGVQMTTAGNAGVLLFASPVMVAVINHLLGWERLGRRAWIGVGIASSGLLLVVIKDAASFRLGGATAVGDLLCLGGALSWAIFTVMTQPLLVRHDALTLAALPIMIGTWPLVAIASASFVTLDWGSVSPVMWTAVGYSTVVVIALGTLVWIWAVRELGGARASLYSYLNPVIALVAGIAVMGERVSAVGVAGVAVTLLGIYICRSAPLTTRTRRKGQVEREPA